MSLWLSGIGVSRGIAIGRVQRLHGGDIEIPEYLLPPEQLDAEVARFCAAQLRAKQQLQQVRTQIPAGAPGEVAAFIDTHLLMLDDRALTAAVSTLIRTRRYNAEAALKRQRDTLVAVSEQMEDTYLQARKIDVQHIAARILRILLNQEKAALPRNEPADSSSDPIIIVADDVTPADIILLEQQGVAAFVTEFGGPLSHSAILARSLGLPAIAGVHNARRILRESEWLIIDGELGHVLADPDDGAREFFRAKRARQLADRSSLDATRSPFERTFI